MSKQLNFKTTYVQPTEAKPNVVKHLAAVLDPKFYRDIREAKAAQADAAKLIASFGTVDTEREQKLKELQRLQEQSAKLARELGIGA